jgi:hypothetical protein
MCYTVAVYLVDLAYGGPEEGGWHYEYGIPSEEHIRFTRGFDTEEDAYAYSRSINEAHSDAWNQGRRGIGSVLSEGQFFAEVRDGAEVKPWPESRPHYE